MASTSAFLLPNMITEHSNTTTKPPQTALCPPFPNTHFETLNSSVPYHVNAAFNVTLAITTTFGNILILLAMRRVTSIRLPSKLLLCSLVLTDLGAGLVVLPQHAAFLFIKQSGQKFALCSLDFSLSFSSSIFSNASLLTLMAISLDRYAALFSHLKYQQIVTTRRVCAVLVFIWLASLFTASTSLWNFPLLLGLIMVSITLAFTVISASYIKIYRRLRAQQVQPHDQAQQQAGNSPNMERYRRTAFAMMWVYVLFLICYFPYLCMAAVTAVRHTVLAVCIQEYAYTLVLLNSCLNPFVYCLRLPDIRIEVMKQLRKFRCQ